MDVLKGEGKLIVLSGPSGCGKNTVFDGLTRLDPDIAHTVSATTRRPRPGETDGTDYYFISEEAFSKRLAAGEFLETVRYGENRYGTLKSEVSRLMEAGKTVVLIIEVNGARNVKRAFPDAVTVFLMPPSMEALVSRISGRGVNTPEETERRIQIAAREMEARKGYDYIVVNDDLNACVEEVYHIIQQPKGEQNHD